MSIGLMTEEEALAKIRERLLSREWWLFIGASELSTEVEETYYWEGDAPLDYDLFMCPRPDLGLVGLMFARKTRMSPQQFVQIADKYTAGVDWSGLLDEGTPEQDIVCAVTDRQTIPWISAVGNWIQGDGAWLKGDGKAL